MSHPNPSHDRGNEYPEDKVTHYAGKKSSHRSVAKMHGDQMSHLLGLVKGGAKSKALAKKMGKK